MSYPIVSLVVTARSTWVNSSSACGSLPVCDKSAEEQEKEKAAAAGQRRKASSHGLHTPNSALFHNRVNMNHCLRLQAATVRTWRAGLQPVSLLELDLWSTPHFSMVGSIPKSRLWLSSSLGQSTAKELLENKQNSHHPQKTPQGASTKSKCFECIPKLLCTMQIFFIILDPGERGTGAQGNAC